jgi:hypothetical protein
MLNKEICKKCSYLGVRPLDAIIGIFSVPIEERNSYAVDENLAVCRAINEYLHDMNESPNNCCCKLEQVISNAE